MKVLSYVASQVNLAVVYALFCQIPLLCRTTIRKKFG
jgi:hypothetical protein